MCPRLMPSWIHRKAPHEISDEADRVLFPDEFNKHEDVIADERHFFQKIWTNKIQWQNNGYKHQMIEFAYHVGMHS